MRLAGEAGARRPLGHLVARPELELAEDVFDVRPVFEEYARRIGLDVERWKKDQTSEAVEQRIFLDGIRAHSLGVKGTPTVFLNGTEVPFEQLTPEGLHPAIDKALGSAGR